MKESERMAAKTAKELAQEVLEFLENPNVGLRDKPGLLIQQMKAFLAVDAKPATKPAAVVEGANPDPEEPPRRSHR